MQFNSSTISSDTYKTLGQSRPCDRRSKRNRAYDFRGLRRKRSKSLHLLPRCESLRASLQRIERSRYISPPLPYPIPLSLTNSRQRKCLCHPRRFLQTRRLQASRRRTQEKRAKTPRPGQQLRLQLGRTLRRVPRLSMDASPHPEPNPRLHHHASRHASPRSSSYKGRSRAGD